MTFAPEPYEERSVKGRVVVVSGASRGLGHRIASQLCGRGARVIAAARGVDASWTEPLEAAAAAGGGRVDAVKCDVSSVSSVRALFKETLPGLGVDAVDVLVNNAGVMPHIFADPARCRRDDGWSRGRRGDVGRVAAPTLPPG